MNDSIIPATISHDQYDKLVDDVYFMGKNTMLKFTVSLSSEYKGDREYFHKEYEYDSKYPSQKTLVTLKRHFDYYLSIESIVKIDGVKTFIRIGVSEILLFKGFIKDLLSWFTAKEYENLFARRGKNIIMLGRPEPRTLNNLPMGKYLSAEPMVFSSEDDSQYTGVRIYLSSDISYVDMTVDRLGGLYYTISTFNMYNSAQNMLNYLGRPENGTNLTTFDDTFRGIDTEEIEGVKAKDGRKPSGIRNKQRSIFTDT